MHPLYYIIMGIIQGITEWLPVSSSGHLVVIQHVYSAQERTLFDAFLHLGTLLAALFYLRRDVKAILRVIWARAMGEKNGRDGGQKAGNKSKKCTERGEGVGDKGGGEWANALSRRGDECADDALVLSPTNVLVASLPIVVIGYFLRGIIEMCFMSIRIVAALFILNGIILATNIYWDRRYARGKHARCITLWNALVIGLGQSIALLPGISRSGATITVARGMRIEPEDAARFSILISIIPIFCATAYKFYTAAFLFDYYYILGFALAFIVGYFAIKALIAVAVARKMAYFGVYTAVLGVILLIML